MKSRVVDMTKGNILKLLVSFMLPMLFGNVFQQFYNIVDSIIVGQFVGADALAAVGATGSINFLFFSLCNGLANGTGIVVSQYFGAGKDKDARKVVGNAVYIMAASAGLMTFLGITFANPILRALHTPENIIMDSTHYMQVICAGIICISVYNCVSAILRAVGDSKTPLYFLIVSSFINIGLDLLFVRGFNMGCIGAAIATVISQLISGGGCLIFAISTNEYFKISKDEFKFDKWIIHQCTRLGVPLAFQSSLIAFSCVALQSVVNTFGSVVVAAFTATSRIEQVVNQPFNSLGMAMSTFTGQNIGAGKEDRVKTGVKYGVMIMLCSCLLFIPMAQFGGRAIMSLFVKEVEVIEFGAHALRLTSWFYIFLGFIYVCRGMLNGAGDAHFSFINGVVEMLGRICFAKPFTLIPGVGVWGVWLATAMTWFVTGLVSIFRYSQGKWKKNLRVNTNEG